MIILYAILTSVVLGFQSTNAMAAGPVNDDFENATLLTQDTVSDVVNNRDATTEPGEPSSAGSKTVWWTYRPSANGRLTITTVGSDKFVRKLSVYLGEKPASLRLVEQISTDSSGAIERFPVTANTDYRISVGNYIFNDGGTVVLGLSLDSQSDIS